MKILTTIFTIAFFNFIDSNNYKLRQRKVFYLHGTMNSCKDT